MVLENDRENAKRIARDIKKYLEMVAELMTTGRKFGLLINFQMPTDSEGKTTLGYFSAEYAEKIDISQS